jgi:hypothetical protein
MAIRGSDWHIRTWARVHASHGTFFIGMHDGEANAQRVYRSNDSESHTVEHLGTFPNEGLAMIACEQRIVRGERSVKLYELTAEFEQLRALAEDAEPGDESLAAAIEDVTTAIEQKAAGIGQVLAQLDADADACDVEIKRLTAKKRRVATNAENLRAYVQHQMVSRDIQAIKGGTFSFALVQCPPRVVVTDEKLVPPEFIRTKTERAVDKVAVLAAYGKRGEGEIVPGTEVVRGVRLQIK